MPRSWTFARVLVASATVIAAIVSTGPAGPASGASASTVVGATVPSATTVDAATGCASNIAGKTSFVSIFVNTSAATTLDCIVTFGSSNSVTLLQIAQSDGVGRAMYRPVTGTYDAGFGSGTGHLSASNMLAVDVSAANVSRGGVGVQSTGKPIVFGEWTNQVVARRYLADGTVDVNFGTLGTYTVALCAGGFRASRLRVMPDDRVVLLFRDSCTNTYHLIRLTANGALDSTFGGGTGRVDTTYDFDVRDMAVHSDGSIVYGGGTTTFELVKVTAAGVVDTAFGGGRVSLALGTGSIRSVGFQSDGKVLAAGYIITGSDAPFVARVTSAGALDTTFGGTDGWEAAPTVMRGRNITVDNQGRLLVTSYEGVSRFTAAGLVDMTFGTNGTFNTRALAGSSTFHGALVQPDDRIILFGKNASTRMLFARINLNGGSIDTTFGTNGFATGSAGFGDMANYAAWGADGTLYAMGPGSGLHLNKFGTVTVADHATATINWTIGANMFGACLRMVGVTATADWFSDGDCQEGNGIDWYGVPIAPETIAHTTVTNTVGAQAYLRFGLRTAVAQPSGTYIAPITFSVVAP